MDVSNHVKEENNLGDEESKVVIDPVTLKVDLYNSAVANETNSVLNYITQGVPGTYVDAQSGWTPLHWAAMHGNLTMLKTLLDSGASQPYHRMVLSLKKMRSNKPTIERSVQNRAVINRIVEGDEEENPADEAKNEEGNTNSSNYYDNMDEDDEEDDEEKALETSTDLTKNTPLLWATYKGHLRAIWLLLNNGYSPNDVDNMSNNSIHLAAANGDIKIMKVLLDDGGNANKVNLYKNTPLDMAVNKDLRDLLTVAMEAGASMTEEDIAIKHAKHIKQYHSMMNSLISTIEEASKMDSAKVTSNSSESSTGRIIRLLSDAINTGKDYGLDMDIVKQGESLLSKLELKQEFLSDYEVLMQYTPIRSQSVYINHVYKLDKTIEKAKAAGVELSQLQMGIDLISRCQAECWLSALLMRLRDVEYADDSHEHDMIRLKQALVKAHQHNASQELMAEASKFLTRLNAELGMSRALKNIPVIRLPMENPPPDYWLEEDVGKVEMTEGYPLPPVETGEYVWIPAESYRLFIESIETLKLSYNGAESFGANPTIVSAAKERLQKADKELKLLEAKDLNDKMIAIEAVKKMAKKLKKSKGSPKKK